MIWTFQDSGVQDRSYTSKTTTLAFLGMSVIPTSIYILKSIHRNNITPSWGLKVSLCCCRHWFTSAGPVGLVHTVSSRYALSVYGKIEMASPRSLIPLPYYITDTFKHNRDPPGARSLRLQPSTPQPSDHNPARQTPLKMPSVVLPQLRTYKDGLRRSSKKLV